MLFRSEYAELRSNAEAMLFTSENTLTEFGEVISAELRAQLGQDVANLRAALDGNADIQSVRELFAALEASAYRIAETMYGGDGGTEAPPEGA